MGKTSIIQKYLKGAADPGQQSTIGAVFHTHEYNIDNKTVTMQIWDTAGQERYKSLGPIYYRKANAAIAVFDLTERSTMTNLYEWIKAFRENADDTFVVIAANKCDLESDIKFTLEETIEWANGIDAEVIWTSAVSGIGIDDIFDAVSRFIIKRQDPSKRKDETIDISQTNSEKKEGCC